MTDLRKAKLSKVPWKFISGRWTSPQRAAAMNPLDPKGWALFLQVSVSREARSMKLNTPYELHKIPNYLKCTKAYLMRLVNNEGRLIVLATEQEDLLQFLGHVDPDYSVLACMALQGQVPVKMVDGKVIINDETCKDHDHVIVDPNTFATRKIEVGT